MNVAVLFKQIPDPASPGKLDPSTNTLVREGKPVDQLTVADLGVPPEQIGVAGAGHQVVAVEAAEQRQSGEIVVDDSDDHETIVAFLEQLKVI